LQQRLWHNRYFIPMDTKRIQKLELWLDELYRAKESIRASKGEFINDQIITQLKKLKIDNFLPLEVMAKKQLIGFLNKLDVATCWLIYDLKNNINDDAEA